MINNCVLLSDSGPPFFFIFFISLYFSLVCFLQDEYRRAFYPFFLSFLFFGPFFTCLDVYCSKMTFFFWRNGVNLCCNECKSFELSVWPVEFIGV